MDMLFVSEMSLRASGEVGELASTELLMAGGESRCMSPGSKVGASGILRGEGESMEDSTVSMTERVDETGADRDD